VEEMGVRVLREVRPEVGSSAFVSPSLSLGRWSFGRWGLLRDLFLCFYSYCSVMKSEERSWWGFGPCPVDGAVGDVAAGGVMVAVAAAVGFRYGVSAVAFSTRGLRG